MQVKTEWSPHILRITEEIGRVRPHTSPTARLRCMRHEFLLYVDALEEAREKLRRNKHDKAPLPAGCDWYHAVPAVTRKALIDTYARALLNIRAGGHAVGWELRARPFADDRQHWSAWLAELELPPEPAGQE